jgi:cAMP-dependent protein kinase regulator
VSAEVFGRYNVKAAFSAVEIPKTQEVKQKIRERLSQAFMFMSLEDKDMLIVINAMGEKTFKAGETVIQEGEPGDVLYIVETGELSCHKVFDGVSKFLKKYQPGDVFGELALLYNAPRAATIKAETDG